MYSMRTLIDVLNEAIASSDVQSSHIDKIEHTGDHLYITFYTGDIYEYDDVSEEKAADMLKQDSKGKFFWREIRNPGKPGGDYPYRKVLAIPESKPNFRWNWNTETWEPTNAQARQLASQRPATTDIIVPAGYTTETPDGEVYIWKGAQWVSTKTGRMARREVGRALTIQSHQEIGE